MVAFRLVPALSLSAVILSVLYASAPAFAAGKPDAAGATGASSSVTVELPEALGSIPSGILPGPANLMSALAVTLPAALDADDKCLNNGSKGKGKALGHCGKSPD